MSQTRTAPLRARTIRMVAAAAAAALLLSACSDAADDSANVTDSTSTAVTDTSAAADDAADAASQAADAAASASAADAAASAAAESAAAAAAESDAAGDSVVAGSLDAQTAAWFTTACNGVAPMGDMITTVFTVGMQMQMATGTEDSGADKAQEYQRQIADAFGSAGSALIGTGQQVSGMPAPTIPNGEQVAVAFSEMVQRVGQQLTTAAEEVRSMPVTDTASLSAALAKLDTLSGDIAEGADVLGGLDPETSAAIQELPACAAMRDSLTGMLGSGE